MNSLSEIESALLHEIVEDYEAVGAGLPDLLAFVMHYFSDPTKSKELNRERTKETLLRLESMRLVSFVLQRFEEVGNNHRVVSAEEPVNRDVMLVQLGTQSNWERQPESLIRYLFIPTEEGIQAAWKRA